MGSLLDLANREVPEKVVLPSGEHQLEVLDVKEKVYSSGRTGYDILLKSADVPNSKLVMHRIFLDKEGDSEETIDSLARNVQNFLKAFGINDTDINTWIGKKAYAILEIEHSEEYGDSNRVRRFVVPK